MKTFFTIILLSLPALAKNCPDFTGQWFCAMYLGEGLKATDTEKYLNDSNSGTAISTWYGITQTKNADSTVTYNLQNIPVTAGEKTVVTGTISATCTDDTTLTMRNKLDDDRLYEQKVIRMSPIELRFATYPVNLRRHDDIQIEVCHPTEKEIQ